MLELSDSMSLPEHVHQGAGEELVVALDVGARVGFFALGLSE
jgi:hypothetical protein